VDISQLKRQGEETMKIVEYTVTILVNLATTLLVLWLKGSI